MAERRTALDAVCLTTDFTDNTDMDRSSIRDIRAIRGQKLPAFRSPAMPLSQSPEAFKLKTLFMGSLGEIPESHSRTAGPKQLAA